MPRIRWSQRCTAQSRRSKGQCRAWAIRGGKVCSAHGGRAPQVIAQAREEFVRGVFDRWLAKAWPAYQERLMQWQMRRVLTVSRLLGIPADRVGWAEIVRCHLLHGVPPLEDEAPRFADMRMDERVRKAVQGR